MVDRTPQLVQHLSELNIEGPYDDSNNIVVDNREVVPLWAQYILGRRCFLLQRFPTCLAPVDPGPTLFLGVSNSSSIR